MFKALIAALSLTVSVQAMAAPSIIDSIVIGQQSAIKEQAKTMALEWKVGDQNDYKLDMGFLKGTLVMKVREVGADGIWMDQDVELSVVGKQTSSMLIDANTGEIKKLIVNGKEEQVPKQNVEIIEVTEDNITVPAGTFDCIHARILDKDTNKESNAWVNPSAIPLSGMLKSVQPGQMGEVTIELTSFKKAN